ncbi:hypothetical protein CLU79DRAFT_703164 [Phycomyces nitens]|nr:hypothetical protein CLU79DRAFT_703164 [Phycomyces nitens]
MPFWSSLLQNTRLIGHICTKQPHTFGSIQLANYVSVSKWLPWEDTVLRDYVKHNGKQWTKLVQHCLPHRTPQSCHGRWRASLDPDLKKGPYSAEEREIIKTWVEEHGVGKWSLVCKKHLPHRSPHGIANLWKNVLKPSIKKSTKWTPEEDALVIKGRATYGENEWQSIVNNMLPDRSASQVRYRYRRFLDPNINTGRWTDEELDLLLRRTIMYGTEDWVKVSEGLPGRLPEMCQDKWTRKVDPSLKKISWDPKEVRLFWELAKVYGGDWVTISKNLPGRSRYACCQMYWKGLQNILGIEYKDLIQCKPDENDDSWKRRMADLVCNRLDNISIKEDSDLPLILEPRKANKPWTPEEDNLLKDLVKEHGTSWRIISTYFPNRPYNSSMRRWLDYLRYDDDDIPKKFNHRLSDLEKRIICEGVHMFGHDWEAISASYLPQRTPQQCMRWWNKHNVQYQEDGRTKYNFWTDEQDKALRFAVSSQGDSKISWSKVAKLVPGRLTDECRIRWTVCIQPNITKGKWSYEESMRLVEIVEKNKLQSKDGKVNWSVVAKELDTGRIDQSCQRKYKRMVWSNYGRFSL